jgi:hypothetical protein
MNNRFYNLLLAPLLFTACNTTQPTTTAKETQKAPAKMGEKASTESQTVVKENVIIEAKTITPTVTTTKNVQYLKKPLIEEQGMLHIDSFMGALQPTLKSAMQSDKSYQTAMGVCASMAMDMTNDYNAQVTDIKIRRTALKYRNEKNKPDALDTKVMQDFTQKGDFTKPVTIDAGTHYRVYKPLSIKKPCLTCHADSSKIPPKVSAMIKKSYPKDLAIGFIEGEFRGVVVAEIQK